MKNMKLFKHFAMGLLLTGSLFGTGCSSDYMDTVPTEKVSVSTMTKSLDNLYAALNGIHRNGQHIQCQILGLVHFSVHLDFHRGQII